MAKATPRVGLNPAADELRVLIRQGHEAAQALATASKAARTQVDDYLATEVQAALNAYTHSIQAEVTKWTKQAVDDIQAVMNKACATAEAHISKDMNLSVVIHDIVTHALAELAAMGYSFTQPHDE